MPPARNKDILIISQNTQGLKSNEKVEILFEVIRKRDIFAACLQETWRKGKLDIDYKNCLLLTNGIDENIPTCRRGKEGVAIALSPTAVHCWKEAGSIVHKDLGPRIIACRLSVKDTRNKNLGLFIVSAYAPIGAADQSLWDNFFEKLRICISRKAPTDILIIGCDTNSSMGTQPNRISPNEINSIGKFGVNHTNRAGIRFQTFLELNSLVASTTYFRKKNYATWNHPRSKLPHQIDHFLCQKHDLRRVIDSCSTQPLVRSDHSAVKCCIRVAAHWQKRISTRMKIGRRNSNDLSNIEKSNAFNSFVINRYQESENYQYSDLSSDMYSAAMEVLPLKSRPQPEWFEANEQNLLNLIEERNLAISAKINRNTRSTTMRLRKARKKLKTAISKAKNDWIANVCNTLNQSSASRKGTKICWDSIKRLRDGFTKPKTSTERKMSKEDGTKAQTSEENAEVFRAHFERLYSRPPNFDPTCIDCIDQRQVNLQISGPPNRDEIIAAIRRLKTNSPGKSGLTAQMFKSLASNEITLQLLNDIISDFWENETPPSDWDIGLLKILPKKGDLSKPGNYRGIMLLEVSYKIIAIIIHQRLQPIVEQLDHETQCGFRQGRGCMDAVFTVKLAMKKRREHQTETWILFLDLVKAFDRVPRELLWLVLLKYGIPPKLVSVIKSLHLNFEVNFEYDGISHNLRCTIGVKQGDILGPVLFIIFLAAIMESWRKVSNRPLCVFKTKNDFKLTGRRHTAKGTEFPLDDSEYADDTAVIFESRDSLVTYSPLLIKHFWNFGMEVHVGDRSQPDKPAKTEILFVAAPDKSYENPQSYDNTDLSPVELGNGLFIPIVERFCYLGTILSRNCKDTDDIRNRIKRASNAFGALRKSLFSNPTISEKVKGSVYTSLILPILLYGSECWCLSENLLHEIRLFHHACIRSMCRVNLSHTFKHRIATESLRKRLDLQSIDSYIVKRHLSWAGHVSRMDFNRIPRKMLSSWVNHKRNVGCPEFTYGRGLYKMLKMSGLCKNSWFEIAKDRLEWSHLIKNLSI